MNCTKASSSSTTTTTNPRLDPALGISAAEAKSRIQEARKEMEKAFAEMAEVVGQVVEETVHQAQLAKTWKDKCFEIQQQLYERT